jgi:hypothetical protein
VTWRVLTLVLVLMLSAAERAAAQKIAYWRELPYGACRFVVDNFGATPDAWQEQLLIAFANPTVQRISLQACAGPGKTCGLSWCGWYFMGTQVSVDGAGYEYPKGFATSITGDNLRDNLWAELAKWQERSDYLRHAFRWQADRIHQVDKPEQWFLSARSWPKSGSADEQGRTFSGLHGKNVLVLVDESGAIPPTVARAGEQALANTHFGKLLQAGNPISHEGMLYDAATLRAHLWTIIRVTGDPDDPNAWVNSPRVNQKFGELQTPREWAIEQIQTYGRENPWVMSYILGQFPPHSINTLLSIEDIYAAQARELAPSDYTWQQKRLGVDVARFGDDRSVIFARQGANARVKGSPVVLRGADTMQIAARVWQAQQKWGAHLILVDDTGHWGHGTIDALRTAGLSPYAIVFHAKAINPRYKNRRAEMWIEMAKDVKRRLALPEHIGELPGELTAVTYTFGKDGQLMLEEKDQVKKRIGRSPDIADALAETYALPDMPAGVLTLPTSGGARPGQADTHYDPLQD